MPRQLNRLELAWAAGFYDGEGCTTGKQWPKLIVVQADRRPLERFQRAVGCGRVVQRRSVNGRLGTKTLWCWEIGDFEHVQMTLGALWPMLSDAKRDQAHRVMLACRAKRSETCVPGNKQPNQKLTWLLVDEIKSRLAAGESGSSVARDLKVSQSLVSQVHLGKRWVA